MSKISVIVPVYKVEKYLNRCVDSILNQSFKDFELILVDDGSPDDCPRICDNYAKKDNRVVVIHKNNGGVSSARNAGLDAAGGGYISFVDSDDFVEKDFLLKLYQGIQGCDMCTCGYYFPLENHDIAQKDFSAKYFTPYDFFKQHTNKDLFVWNKLFSKHLFDNNRFKEGIIFEDSFIFTHLVFSCKKISSIDDKLYCYACRDGSLSSSNWKTNLHKYYKLLGFYDSFSFLYANGIDFWKQYYCYSISLIKELSFKYSPDIKYIFVKLRSFFFLNIFKVFSISKLIFFCFPRLFIFFKNRQSQSFSDL